MKTVSLFYRQFLGVFLLALLANPFNSKAQDSLLKANQFKAGLKLAGLGASYERQLSKSLTLYSEASINLTNGIYSWFSYAYVDPTKSQYDYYDGTGYVKISAEERKSYSWVPLLSTEMRHYYNMAKRTSKDKITRNNSFNFVGFGASYSFRAKTNLDNVKQGSETAIYANWGIQRSVGKLFSFEFNLAPGLAIPMENGSGSAEFQLGGNLKFDFVIK